MRKKGEFVKNQHWKHWYKVLIFCVNFRSCPIHLALVPFNTWLISSWEEAKCCYKLSKCTKWHKFYSKWSKLSIWVKIVVILSVAWLVITFIFFSAWDNSTQKMRTYVLKLNFDINHGHNEFNLNISQRLSKPKGLNFTLSTKTSELRFLVISKIWTCVIEIDTSVLSNWELMKILKEDEGHC